MSSLSPEVSKRRRLNSTTTNTNKPRTAAAIALAKPFKSPVKSSRSPTNNKLPSVRGTSDAYSSTSSTPSIHHPPTSTLPVSKNSLTAPQRTTSGTTRSTAAQILALRAEIDTLTQALNLLRRDNNVDANADGGLRALITKWRGVSQAAAEAVFDVMLERVEGMGGVPALRERERDSQFEEEKEDTSFISDEPTEITRSRNKDDERSMDHLEGEEKTEHEESQTFTMEMMLQKLGIKLEVIGFDTDEQTWAS